MEEQQKEQKRQEKQQKEKKENRKTAGAFLGWALGVAGGVALIFAAPVALGALA